MTTPTKSASPAVRRLAEKHNLNVDYLRGSGVGGRVTTDDVRRAAAIRDGSYLRHDRQTATDEAVYAALFGPQASSAQPPAGSSDALYRQLFGA